VEYRCCCQRRRSIGNSSARLVMFLPRARIAFPVYQAWRYLAGGRNAACSILAGYRMSMATHGDQHKVVDGSILEQSAADNLATIVNRGREQRIQIPVRASREECA